MSAPAAKSKPSRSRPRPAKIGRAKLRRDDQKANRGRQLRTAPTVATAEPEMAVAA